MINIEPMYSDGEYEKVFFNKTDKLGKVYKVLEEDIALIRRRIELYDFTKEKLEKLNELVLPKTIFDKLEGLYDLQNETVELLKIRVKEHHVFQEQTNDGMTCVYCGVLRYKAEDLDHYLPRSRFPEFSILAQNLIYVCKTCNQTYKKALFIDEHKVRYILNPYFDNLDDSDLLECTVDFSDIRTLSVEYKINPDLKTDDPYLYEIACNHFETLDLKARYFSIINSDCWHKFKNRFTVNTEFGETFIDDNDGKKIFEDYVNREIDSHKNRPNNNFEKLFWEQLKSNDTFLSSLPGKILPKTILEWKKSHETVLGFDQNTRKYGDIKWTTETYTKLCSADVIDLFTGPSGINAIIAMLEIIQENNSNKIENALCSLEKSIKKFRSEGRPFTKLQEQLDKYKALVT